MVTQERLNNAVSGELTTFHVLAKDFERNDSEAAQETLRVSKGLKARENALAVELIQDSSLDVYEASLKSWEPRLEFRYGTKLASDTGALAREIAIETLAIFSEESGSLTYLLKDSPFTNAAIGSHLTSERQESLDKRTTRAFKYASTYHLTFSLFTSSASPSSWQMEEAVQQYLQPLIARLSSISDFTIDTQVQLYASFSPSIAGPQYDSQAAAWLLQPSDLSGFVNAAEWPLSPSIGSGPTINFVLYVPSQQQSPLKLAETGGYSWLIPQWGGVQILNPTSKQSDLLTIEDLRPVMLMFADQLMSLVGVPSSPASLSLRINSLTRERATSLLLSTASTLGALLRLTEKLQSIAIPKSVANSVDDAIHHLEQACQNIREGRFQSGLENARIANDEAEQAFFEPSMVGQVYFPEEHKVAVYVPLLGPMAVPLVMSALKEFKSWRKRKLKST